MRTVKAGSLLLAFLILLIGCEPAFTSSPDDDLPGALMSSSIEPTPYGTEQLQDGGFPQSVDIADEELSSVSFRPNEALPELNITFDLVGELAGEFYSDYYYLCSVSQNDEVIQTYRIHSYEMLQLSHVYFIDIDFDGFLDMGIRWVSGSTNWSHVYYRYDSEKNAFEETILFCAIGRGVKFYPDTEQAIVTIYDGYNPFKQEMHQYANGNYTHVRTENASTDFETGNYDVSITELDKSGDWVVIYSVTLTEDEYYGDLTARDNYLRFGMENAP